jgi:hypothetical protein
VEHGSTAISPRLTEALARNATYSKKAKAAFVIHG